MAGPYNLGPDQSKHGIPTWGGGKLTKVFVTNATSTVGRIRMQCGLSAPEENEIRPGGNEFARDFGGNLLNVTNEGSVALTVTTQ
jgi:hypothetical protein